MAVHSPLNLDGGNIMVTLVLSGSKLLSGHQHPVLYHHEEDVNRKASSEWSTVDFSGLILGFSSAALFYMGHDAIEGKKNQGVNLPLAEQNIAIVQLLQKKTQGNLAAEEAELLQRVLSDLQEKYRKLTVEG
jgi:hypothetical protein